MFCLPIRAGRGDGEDLWLNFGLFGWSEKVWEVPGYTSLCCPWLVFGAIIAQVTNVRQCLRRQAGKAGWFLAFALAFLVCVLPANADTLRTKHAAAPDHLFEGSTLFTAGAPAPSSPDSVLRAEELRDGFSLATLHSEADTLDLLANPDDGPSDTGAKGVRRFIVLTILFGAVLRYLTSATFYNWAAEVFDPLEY